MPPTAEQEELLSAWRALALSKMPYMATMLFSLRPLNVPGLGTFAVDPQHRVYVDFAAVEPKGVRWCAEALLHECCHLFADHAARACDAGVEPWEHLMSNMASDAEINDDLRDAGCDMSDAVVPEALDLEPYQLYEFYLAALRAKRQRSGGGMGSPTDSQSGQSGAQSQPEQSGQGDQPGSGSASGQTVFIGCGSASGGAPAPCEIGDDLGGEAPGLTPSQHAQTVFATAATIRQYHVEGRGHTPAGLVERSEALLAPSKIPWRRLLSSAIKRSVASKMGDFDVTYSRRNRRRHSGRVIFPGTYSPQPSLAVVRDTSGSMGKPELDRVSVEVDAIAKRIGIRGRDLRVLDVDAMVHRVHTYTGLDSIAEIHGRGGTDMGAGIEAAVALKPRPNAVVVITDGDSPWPIERPPIPVVVCLVGPGAERQAASVPVWARTVVVED